MPARRWLICGLVQGVGFRYATQREAARLGLAGWVRNRADGSVEMVALGDDRQLDAMHRWAQRGPPSARVETVEQTRLEDDALDRLEPALGEGFRQVGTSGA